MDIADSLSKPDAIAQTPVLLVLPYLTYHITHVQRLKGINDVKFVNTSSTIFDA